MLEAKRNGGVRLSLYYRKYLWLFKKYYGKEITNYMSTTLKYLWGKLSIQELSMVYRFIGVYVDRPGYKRMVKLLNTKDK